MKAITSSFLDYYQANLDKQYELFNKFNLTTFCIRKIGGKEFANFLNPEEYIKFFIQKRIDVSLFDPLIPPYFLNNEEQTNNFREVWIKAINFAVKIKSDSIVYELPIFEDVIAQKEQILLEILKDISLAKNFKLKVVIKFSKHHKHNIYFYLLNHLPKGVSVLFDPTHIYLSKESITTSFRVLKNHITYVICDDIDKNNHPRLIGYGEVNWIELFKKLYKIDFSGLVILDLSVLENIINVEEKTSFFKRFTKGYKLKNKLKYDLEQRVGSTDEESIIDSQLKVLSHIMYNKKE